MYGVDIMNNLVNTFLGGPVNNGLDNTGGDLGTTDNMPRYNSGSNANVIGNLVNFAKTLYELTK